MSILSPVTGKANTSIVKEIDTKSIISLYDSEFKLDVTRFFGSLDKIYLYKCNDTGYRFYYPFDIFGDDAFYQHLQEFEGYYSTDKWEYHEAYKHIGDGLRVLEIGSGGGYFLQRLAGKNCTRLTGLELNTDAVAKTRKKGLDVINETIEVFSEKNAGSFDVVCTLQVLEHISSIQSFISSALKVLRPGGKLIICVPNNNPYLYKHDLYHTLNLPPHHAGLWDRSSFSRLPGSFPMTLDAVSVEPLTDYKKWYQTQTDHLKEKGHPAYRLLSIVPRPVYKGILRSLRHFIQGRNILVSYIKT